MEHDTVLTCAEYNVLSLYSQIVRSRKQREGFVTSFTVYYIYSSYIIKSLAPASLGTSSLLGLVLLVSSTLWCTVVVSDAVAWLLSHAVSDAVLVRFGHAVVGAVWSVSIHVVMFVPNQELTR